MNLSSRADEEFVSQEAFNALLNWLHTDRKHAWESYQNIRAGLLMFFECHGCQFYEECTDDTIRRAAIKISTGTVVRPNNPYVYFHGIARNVLREYWKGKERLVSPLDDLPANLHPINNPFEIESREEEKLALERNLKCLEKCLNALPQETRELLINYYISEQEKRSEERNHIADQLGITLNALRIRIHRLSSRLEKCIKDCVEDYPEKQ
ncbi:MAG: hypothetical protein AB1489_40015, partial [Acidobacteriota bacterium]